MNHKLKKELFKFFIWLLGDGQKYLGSIDHYFDSTKSHIGGLLEELDKQHELNNDAGHLQTVVWYYKSEIIYNISKIEIHCRALRDKLKNG